MSSLHGAIEVRSKGMEKSDIAGAEWEGLIRRNLQSFGYIKQGVQGNGLFNVGSFRVAGEGWSQSNPPQAAPGPTTQLMAV